jgi:3-phosphoglycerate kinase
MKDLKAKLITKVRGLKGKRVLLRLDLNVPINEVGEIEETFRIDAVIPTIQFLVEKEAKVIIISHIGSDGKQSLAPVVAYLSKHFNTAFFPDLDNLFHIEDLKNGEVGIVENIRRAEGEMTNSPKIAKELALLADIYVNEAFAVSHREHSSIVGVPKILPSYVGPLFLSEYENLEKVFTPKHPFLFILGGMKFQTKIPLLKNFVKKADYIFVGGALANSFFKKMGYEIGKSLADSDLSGMTEFLQAENIFLPVDVVAEVGGMSVKKPEEVKAKETIVDIGPGSVEDLKKQISEAKFILWNGPMGNFEKSFSEGTLEVAKAVAGSKAYSVVGGGDTVSAISELGLEKKFGFVSTAGGAMLDFLANGTLPGIEAILK